LRTAISLFTGVGGLDFGLEAAGFSTAVALECDAVACSTILLSRKWPVIKDDARRVSSVEILARAQLKKGQFLKRG
jgi:DNA (cytosine-5)-methyltransferase 1